MRRHVTAAAICLALGVAACGSTSSSDNVPATGQATSTARSSGTPTAPRRTYTYAATSPSTASAPATVTTATITQPDSGGAGLTGASTAAVSECTAADLSAAAVPPNGAAGTVVFGFTLRNTGSEACDTYGWPGIAFVSSAGAVVATQTTRTTRDILGSTPPTKFTVAPGAQASFRVTVRDSNDQGGCGSYSTVQIIAPNDTATTRVKLPNGPAEVCGAASVSPLEPGTSATGQ
jgi:hypothetical protein